MNLKKKDETNNINQIENKKQKTTRTTTATTLNTKLAIGLVTSILVLSSIAAAQLLVSNNHAAFAAIKCDYVDNGETIEQSCTGGEGLRPTEESEAVGGGGGQFDCTFDYSTFNEECTGSGGRGTNSEGFNGGGGSRVTTTYDYPIQTYSANGGGGGNAESHVGGTGGKAECTLDLTTGEEVCPVRTGGSGIHPR